MTKAEIIEYIDKTLKLFEKEYKLEIEESKADLLSDFYIFDIEFKIAQFAVENNHFAKIKDLTLHQLTTEEDIKDEDGFDVNISELISNWVSTTGKSIIYDFVQQDIPKPEILEVINYYESKIYSD